MKTIQVLKCEQNLSKNSFVFLVTDLTTMIPSRYIESISKHFQKFSQHSLPQLRQELERISSSLDVIIEENRRLNVILPVRLLEAAGDIERVLEEDIVRLELKTKGIGDKIQNLEREFCREPISGMWWFASILIIQVFGSVGLLFGLNVPEIGLLEVEAKIKILHDDIMELAEDTEELMDRVSMLHAAIQGLHAQVFRESLTFRVERSHECDTRGRD